MFARDQLKRAASLTEENFVQLGNCRRVETTPRVLSKSTTSWRQMSRASGRLVTSRNALTFQKITNVCALIPMRTPSVTVELLTNI
jgi:hypothetical protein